MKLDDVTISRIITKSFMEDFQRAMDVEVAIVKIVINKAFDNDKIDGRVLKTFRKVKNKL